MSSTFNQDKELAEFFTDVEYLRNLFKSLVAASTLTKRLLVIHGVGGVGKSSLLRMFRLHCKGAHVPVALASGDEAKSALDVLVRWTEDLKADSVVFSAFGKTYEHYRAIQAKVDEQAKKAQDARGRAADIAGKAASKTAEAAGGTLAGAAIGSVIPGIGTAIGGVVGGVLGGIGAEALVDWLRGFLTKPDIDLLLDPAKKLTDDFLADVAQAADKRRVVLLLDTFEQMTALDDWTRDVTQRVHSNILLVIAGRALPNWSRAWQGWMANAYVEELKPMSEADMRELVRRYYATMRGGEPNSTQVEAIIRFARGLPMVVTTAVQLWVKYGIEDFEAVKPEIVANLVDRLMEGVPNELIPALEAAAIVRWFDQPILRAVLKQDDVRDKYNELRRFPFVRTRAEGFALHDALREIIDENLRSQDSERHRVLHESAAAYFEKRSEEVSGEEADRLGLERLYHRVRADEEAGIKLFQEIAEELTRYRLVNRLRAVLNDTNTYPLERENSILWREYYDARLASLEVPPFDAEKVYQAIGENENAEPKLRAYALCDWGTLLSFREALFKPDGTQKAMKIVETSQNTYRMLDTKLILNLKTLSDIFAWQGDFDKAFSYLERVLEFYDEQGDYYGVARVYQFIQSLFATRGDWKSMFAAQAKGLETLPSGQGTSSLYAELISGWAPAQAFAGRYAEAEKNVCEALAIHQQRGETDFDGNLRDLGLILAFQGKYQEADEYISKCISLVESWGRAALAKTTTQRLQAIVLLRGGKADIARKILAEVLPVLEWAKYFWSLGELLTWLGLACECTHEWTDAVQYYRRSLGFRHRRYFECGALTGLVRIEYAQGDYSAIKPLLAEAELLAQQYEYNDHLTSLRLTQGMASDKIGLNGQATPLDYFKQAMIYALRYNRFMLDEVLSGRAQGTPLNPIVPYCLELGEEGRQILIALRDWWKIGINDIGVPRPDTISLIPEGISLLEAERLAREREPGDGSPQKSVIEQIESALAD